MKNRLYYVSLMASRRQLLVI